MRLKFLTSSPRQTKKMGEILAQEILKIGSRKKARVIGLVGDLGGGKTTFVQGFAKGLRMKEKILSPTFVIIKRFKNFYHIDCYRIKEAKELLDLGFKEIIFNPKNIIAIEWADRVRKIVPQETIWINFDFIDRKIRKIIIQSKYGR